MAFALRAIGKSADVVFDAVPPHILQPFAGVDCIQIAKQVDRSYDAAVILECAARARSAG